MSGWLERLRKLLPACAVASAFVATVAIAGAERTASDAWNAELLRTLSRTLGSFRGMGPTEEHVETLARRAALVRRSAHFATAIFAVTALTSLWIHRARARHWPYLSALYFALSLLALYWSVHWFGPIWLLPLVLGAVVAGLAAFELIRAKRRGVQAGAVTWGALVAASFAVVASTVGVR